VILEDLATVFETLADERHERREQIRDLKTEGKHEVVDLPNPLIRRTTVN